MDSVTVPVDVVEASYDAENQFLVVLVRLEDGSPRIIYSHKSDWHKAGGKPGDFPDEDMVKFGQLMIGKKVNWTHCTEDVDPKSTTEAMKKVKNEMYGVLQKMNSELAKDENILAMIEHELVNMSKDYRTSKIREIQEKAEEDNQVVKEVFREALRQTLRARMGK